MSISILCRTFEKMAVLHKTFKQCVSPSSQPKKAHFLWSLDYLVALSSMVATLAES